MDIELLLEAEKRGILPEDKASLLAEARKRGLVPALEGAPIAAAPETASTPEKSFGTKLKENLLGDDDPTTQNLGEKVGSFLNKAGESMTMGLIGDEASAAVESVIPGVNYEKRRDHYRQQEEILERDNPGAALTADIGGAMVAPLGALGALGKGASILKKIGASAATTGALSGIYGFSEGEGSAQERLNDGLADGAVGAGIGSMVPIAGAGIQRVADALTKSKAVKSIVKNAPTTEQLRAAGRKAYDEIEAAGVTVKPEAVQRGVGDIIEALKGEGAGYRGSSKIMPSTVAIREALEDFTESKANTHPYKELDVMRRFMGNAAGSNIQNKGDTRLATKALGQFDEFVENLGPDDIDAGDLEVLQSTLPKARDLWAKMSRSQTIDDAIDAGENYVSGSSSGVRNQFARILRNKNLNRGFSPEELKMMRKVVNGSIPERLVHLVGGGLGQLFSAGGGLAIGGPVGAGIGLGAGVLARKGSEAISSKNAEIVRALIASGGTKQLPKASDKTARLIEQLMRQGTAAGVQ